MSQRFTWGHININVSDLEASVEFYGKLGFTSFIPAIPYLNLNAKNESRLAPEASQALGLPGGLTGRACIMQLDDGFPKIDLTELSASDQRPALENKDLGVVRICLVSEDLNADYQHLSGQGVRFLSPPAACHDRLADVATCADPDGTLIELLQVHLERWTPYLG